MLKQRVLTALALLAVLVAALAAPSTWPYALITVLMIGAAGWEWGRLNAAGSALALALGVVVAVASFGLCLWVSRQNSAVLWWAVGALWIFGGSAALRLGPQAWAQMAPAPRWLIGVLVLAPAWAAMYQAYVQSVNFLLSAMALVWAADIAAYFGGKRFGKRKLAPSISPGKSWEGVFSGMLGALALAAGWITLDLLHTMDGPSLYTQLMSRVGVFGLGLGVLGLCAMSVVGDLFESLIKRAAGAKDSSGLLPGHGGVLDRIDALLPVMPLALALGGL